MEKLNKKAIKLLKIIKAGKNIYQVNEYADFILSNDYKDFYDEYWEMKRLGFINHPTIREPQEEYEREMAAIEYNVPEQDRMITPQGEAYLESAKLQRTIGTGKIIAWLITTGIAITALIIAIVK